MGSIGHASWCLELPTPRVVACAPVSWIARALRTGFDDYRSFVNRLVAERAAIAGEPVQATRSRGGQMVDDRGRLVEDLFGSQAFGHRHPTIAAAVREVLDSDVPTWFPSRVNPFAGRLASELCERAGAGAYSSVTLASSGTEAVEAAIKLARAVTKRPRLLSLDGAYHGCTMGSVALMTAGPHRDPFAPHLPGGEMLPFDDVAALERALAPGDVAAVVVEPIQIEGGVRACSAGYLDALCDLTARRGTLLIADEVQTGMGRTGRFLASERWPRRPDVVLLGKHLGGGLLPISAMLTRRELFEAAYGENFETAESHNSTFGGNALACVAAMAALDLVTPELLARVAETGAILRRDLTTALAGLAIFDHVRGDGLAVGIVLRPTDHPWLEFGHFGMESLAHQPTTGVLLCQQLHRHGFFTVVCGHDWRVVRILPRFAIEREQIAAFVAAVRAAAALLSDAG